MSHLIVGPVGAAVLHPVGGHLRTGQDRLLTGLRVQVHSLGRPQLTLTVGSSLHSDVSTILGCFQGGADRPVRVGLAAVPSVVPSGCGYIDLLGGFTLCRWRQCCETSDYCGCCGYDPYRRLVDTFVHTA